MNICPHCKNKFLKGKSFGAHITNCSLNPKHQKIIDKIINTKRKKWKTFNVKCHNFNCNKN